MSKMKRYEFIDSNDITSTYAGEVADQFFAAALEAAASLNNGGVTIMEGITHKQVLPTVNISDPVAAAACTLPAEGDNITIAESVLELTDLAVREDVCIGALVPLWHSYVRSASRNDIVEPRFIDFLLAQTAKAVGQSLERGIWRGTSPYGVGFQSNDGTLDEAGADASIFAGFHEVDFANALAASDILTDMASVLDSAIANAPAILDAPGAGFYMGREAYWFYAQALSAAGSNAGQFNGGAGYAGGNLQGLTYQGFPVYMCPGMFADTIVLTYPGNLYVGTSAQTDFNDIRAVDMRGTTGDDLIRIIGRMQVGVQVANSADGVFGSTVWT
jgi:hypothetical protein